MHHALCALSGLCNMYIHTLVYIFIAYASGHILRNLVQTMLLRHRVLVFNNWPNVWVEIKLKTSVFKGLQLLHWRCNFCDDSSRC